MAWADSWPSAQIDLINVGTGEFLPLPFTRDLYQPGWKRGAATSLPHRSPQRAGRSESARPHAVSPPRPWLPDASRSNLSTRGPTPA